MVLKEEIIEILKNYLDPELGIDVWTLGFVRKLDFNKKKQELKLLMTLTSPMCPMCSVMGDELKKKLMELGLKKVSVEFTFDPPWEPPKEVREMLGM